MDGYNKTPDINKDNGCLLENASGEQVQVHLGLVDSGWKQSTMITDEHYLPGECTPNIRFWSRDNVLVQYRVCLKTTQVWLKLSNKMVRASIIPIANHPNSQSSSLY